MRLIFVLVLLLSSSTMADYRLGMNAVVSQVVVGGSVLAQYSGADSLWIQNRVTGAYDYMTARGVVETDALLKASYHGICWRVPFVDIDYSLDQMAGVYTIYSVIGAGKKLTERLTIEGGVGIKMGNMDRAPSNYDVINARLSYKGIGFESEAKVFLPREFLSHWVVDSTTLLMFRRRIVGFLPTAGFTFRRDYLELRYMLRLGLILEGRS